ncbi:MAG: class I SAM-dependent methyltransferase [Lachnospiraceae bacterium]|jgi:tRNA (adenine22-N1)-methyltransferase|nr:class I SAM-dependent methyltransferase [Lachnospiraceae bacterium]MCI1726563.1 class I SAM-dependent methyltransferase [Lachnospiraceae bacterium]
MKLSDRLSAIADMAAPGNPVTDVGCDHAWIPICLVEKGTAPYAVACDLREGPLRRAEEHIREAGLEGKIRTVCCDGVPAEELSGTLIISGMGGMLMGRILQDAGKRLDSFSEFIFEPQSELKAFRRILAERNLRIEDEQLILEDGKYYTVMKAVHGRSEMTPAELSFGPVLLKKKDHVLFGYLEKQEKIKKEILAVLRNSGGEAAGHRAAEVEEELREIAAAKENYEVRDNH